MKIYFERNSLEISNRKVISGIISITLSGDSFFPEERWNDSIVILLDSWIKRAIAILNEENDDALFTFFDGPFSFRIMSNKGTVELLKASKQTELHDISFPEFVLSLIGISKEVLNEIKGRGWSTDDLTQLGMSVEELIHCYSSRVIGTD